MSLASTAEIVITACATALATAAVAALAFFFRWLMRRRSMTTGVILIRIPQRWASDNRLHFGLLHIRDGKDEATGQGPLVNRAVWFSRPVLTRAPAERAVSDQRETEKTVLTTSVRYARALGLQFKCFVDFTEMTYDDLLTLFSEDRATTVVDVAREPQNAQRAWFLLTSYETVETPDGFRNNFIYPTLLEPAAPTRSTSHR